MVSRVDWGEGIRRHIPSNSDVGSRNTRALDWSKVQERCGSLGFVAFGVATAEPFPKEARALESFLSEGLAGDMSYLAARRDDGRLLREEPRSVFSEARTVISVALPYDGSPGEPDSTVGNVARYARGQDYHHVLRNKLLELADSIAQQLARPLLARVCVDSAPLFERQLAARAGYAFIGKHTLSIVPGRGSYVLLGELLVDEPHEAPSLPSADACGSCTACLDACPTEAFQGPWKLDATRCISYLTIESSADIPPELRSSLGNRIFGCDVCQDVCPYNRTKNKPPADSELRAKEELRTPSLLELFRLSNGDHKRLVKGSALSRASRNQLTRNVAVALGNSGALEAVAPLEAAAATHRSAQVREHAMWALEELSNKHSLREAAAAIERLTDVGD